MIKHDFLTSDWHFNHSKEFIYKPRGFDSAEEMNSALVERHNSLVTSEDDVYILGDLCLGGAESLEKSRELISSMNGKLHVVLEIMIHLNVGKCMQSCRM